ncbi:CAP domain-containing protein [Streptomyces glaucosporus]|uniref:CAP domain-containing protein n=1 Tax=Streptomyces glaucosporus TaxID=284044 RepID=UPI0031DCF59C
MSKHRRTRHYRKISIAVIAAAAVGVPTAATAYGGGSGSANGWYPFWQRASADERPARTAWTPRPAASASQTPTTSPSASASAAPAGDAAARVVELANSERQKAGCAPLKVNEKLTQAAQAHSQDMAEHRNMSHTGSDGSSPGDRIEKAGYTWRTYGENVAYGYRTPESVMEGWMTSPGHKRNILNCAFKEIGVGLAQPGNYWTQDFGTAR